ncbi:MAG: uncharacterized protein KVP18_005001 [Porospora cf. gigantea A]|uniref:uncharacterized protein n=1 Tax=Porospora cf. gigantea A TaxID=2853593 RepID=UPI00355A9C98|nr:MAG: hypothetical protein KVP18_005001 [Porospora cf. gigantea A]
MLSCGDPSVDTLLNGGVAVGEWLHLDFDSLFGRDRCRRILAEFAHNALGQAVPVLVIDCGARLTEPQAVVCRPQGLSELRSVLSALTDSALQSTCVVVTDMDIALGSVIHLAPSRLASLDEQLYRLACSAGFLFVGLQGRTHRPPQRGFRDP